MRIRIPLTFPAVGPLQSGDPAAFNPENEFAFVGNIWEAAGGQKLVAKYRAQGTSYRVQQDACSFLSFCITDYVGNADVNVAVDECHANQTHEHRASQGVLERLVFEQTWRLVDCKTKRIAGAPPHVLYKL